MEKHLFEENTPTLTAPLRLSHALRHNNWALAATLCRTRPLTEADKAEVLAYYAENVEFYFLGGLNPPEELCISHQQETHFLDTLLTHCPDLLTTPQIRSAVAAAALVTWERVERLEPWVQRMEDGPVEVRDKYPMAYAPNVLVHYRWLDPNPPHLPLLFDRWDARLGSRLTPVIDVASSGWNKVSSHHAPLLVERFHFTGSRASSDHLHAVAKEVLFHAPEAVLLRMAQPGSLLSRENPQLVLDACDQLPPARRNLLLPHIHKTPAYDL